MEQKKKGSPRSKEPETLADYLRQSKGLLLPKRIEGKPKGAAISTSTRKERVAHVLCKYFRMPDG